MAKKTEKGIGIAGKADVSIAVPTISKDGVHREMQYRARADAHTLAEADQIRRDSGRMRGVKDHHKSLTRAIQGPKRRG